MREAMPENTIQQSLNLAKRVLNTTRVRSAHTQVLWHSLRDRTAELSLDGSRSTRLLGSTVGGKPSPKVLSL
jgi:hypothetical protein